MKESDLMLHDLAVYLSGSGGAVILIAAALLLLAFAARVCISAGKQDRIDSLLMAFFFIELSAVFILLSFGFEEAAEDESSPALVPRIWGCSLFLCSILQFVKIWHNKNYKPVKYGHVGKVAAVLGVVAVTIMLFNTLGFFVSTGAMLLALMYLMGERRPLLMCGTAAVWMFATWGIFNKLLLLGLPVGTLFQ